MKTQQRDARTLYADALHVLLRDEIASTIATRDFELLVEVARLASDDAPLELATSDPALFATWRSAVTRYHLAGWGYMTPERVKDVCSKQKSK